MVARLKKTEDGFTVPLTAEMVEELHLQEGAAVEVRPLLEADEEQTAKIEYGTPEEALEAYEKSKAKFGRAYEALAK
jgi:hypothetical protein